MNDLIPAVTEFLFLSNPPEKADAILIPGSIHPPLSYRAATLYHQGYAPLIVPSGRYTKAEGHIKPLPPPWTGKFDTEADFLSGILLEQGVPASAILPEREATFTWENALCTRALLEKENRPVHRAILCCRPFHARRALFYYQTAFPETTFLVCPCEEEAIRPDNWFLTPLGRQKVLGEVAKMGTQINDILGNFLSTHLPKE